MTKQEILARVRAYALTMTAPAGHANTGQGSPFICEYRSPNGPCLIGHLVSDEVALVLEQNGGIEDFDELIWNYLAAELEFDGERAWLNQVQNAHDDAAVQNPTDPAAFKAAMLAALDAIEV